MGSPGLLSVWAIVLCLLLEHRTRKGLVRINTAASGKPTGRTLLPDFAALGLVLLEAPALPSMAASSPLAGCPDALNP